MPFSLNPFSKKKLDFSDMPKAPQELDGRKPLHGQADDERINSQQSSSTRVEKTVIKEQAEKDDDLPPAYN
jgi:hypothetical protein